MHTFHFPHAQLIPLLPPASHFLPLVDISPIVVSIPNFFLFFNKVYTFFKKLFHGNYSHYLVVTVHGVKSVKILKFDAVRLKLLR